MKVSVFDLFSVGIGPSSSHTVGPMRAAFQFVERAHSEGVLTHIKSIRIDLYGSLALTGRGHATDKAILLGLLGYLPDTVNPDTMDEEIESIQCTHQLLLFKQHQINFDYESELIFHHLERLDFHTNAMTISGFNESGVILSETFYSVGGGFIVTQSELDRPPSAQRIERPVPYPFSNARSLLGHCIKHDKTIAEIIYANERVRRSDQEIANELDKIWNAMKACLERGLTQKGILPGGLNVRRRAATLAENLENKIKGGQLKESSSMEWLNAYAMAVNEENAAGKRMVTAPTNGAAGIIPAVLYYYMNFTPEASQNSMRTFLLTAGGIGILYKEQASISGAEVGCQGEVGVACSMASAALTAVLGGSIYQVENAAEMGMEHHLGMTCDPINGLVQIPCIERNAMAAVRAVNCAKLALIEDGQHIVSLDKVIKTMKQTGEDMLAIYKETSQGGLAVNHPEC